MKAIALLLAIMMLTSLMAGIVDARSLKYSELVNVSAKEFAESINNNVSALEHDMDLANETHNYDAIVKDADLIGQQESILSKMIDALNMADLRHQSDELYTMTHHSVFHLPR